MDITQIRLEKAEKSKCPKCGKLVNAEVVKGTRDETYVLFCEPCKYQKSYSSQVFDFSFRIKTTK